MVDGTVAWISRVRISEVQISELYVSSQSGGDLMLVDGHRHTPQFYAKSGMLEDILSILTANGCVDDSSDASSIVDMNSAPLSYQ